MGDRSAALDGLIAPLAGAVGVVEFMIRQSAFFYGMHGVLIWCLATDVIKYRPLVRLIGWTYLLFGPVFGAINWQAGTPLWWTICDPLVIGLFGILILVLDRWIPPEPAPPG